MTVPLGSTALVFTLVYLVVIVSVAVYASYRERRRHDDPLVEHELGGRELSFLVLLGTLYASQYSGNSFIGFTGKAARDGFAFLGSAVYMQCVIIGYLIFAPRLFRLSRVGAYRTPGDLIWDRFSYRPLHLAVNLIMLFGLLNFILSQLVAIGNITRVLSVGVDGTAIHPAWGIFTLAVLMGLYENLGGMRAVAWTDLLQGLVLFAGATGLFLALEGFEGGFAAALETYATKWPEKLEAPSGAYLRTWVGSMIMLGVGASVYPHAIQRIYAARSARTLKRSLAFMVFMPLLTTFPMFLVGIKAQSLYGDTPIPGDQAMPFLLGAMGDAGTVTSILVLIVLAAAVSAMMSTADSALLTTSSIINRDFLERFIFRDRSPEFHLRFSKLLSWMVLLPLAAVATWSVTQGHTIWAILSIKLELLMQTAPAIWIGVRTRRLPGRVAFAGLLAGSGFTLCSWLIVGKKLYGVQAGVWGLAINLAICLVGLWLSSRRKGETQAEAQSDPG